MLALIINCGTILIWPGILNFGEKTWRMVEIYREISSGIHPSLLFIVVSGQIWDLQPNPLSSSRFPFLSDPHLKERKGSSESRKWWRNGWKKMKAKEEEQYARDQQ